MNKINIDLTSKITQDKETQTIHQHAKGSVKENEGITRLAYLEKGTIPVKMLVKKDEFLIRRGGSQNYSFLRFVPGEKAACRYVLGTRQMDLTSVTHQLAFGPTSKGKRLHVEYDLFSGLYLVGNYLVTLLLS